MHSSWEPEEKRILVHLGVGVKVIKLVFKSESGLDLSGLEYGTLVTVSESGLWDELIARS